MSPQTRAGRIVQRTIIALFVTTITLPLVGMFAGWDLMPEGNDMRERAQLPELRLNVQFLSALPIKLEAYVKDHFGFRGPLIRGLSLARVFGLGVSASPNVILGKDGWLYFSHECMGSDYHEVRPFTQDELARWARVLIHRHEWLAQRNCRYLLFLTPDKQTIYPEHFPAQYRRDFVPGRRLEQLVGYLREHAPQVAVLDVRAPLLKAKETERIYNRTDTHWNARGAFVAYQELARALGQWFPQVQPVERSQMVAVERDTPGGDLAGLLDLRDVYREQSLDLVPGFALKARPSKVPVVPPQHPTTKSSKGGPVHTFLRPAAAERPDTDLPRGLMFHDSFSLAYADLLREHFQRLAWVWHDDFFQNVVQSERPDVVIQQLLERKLGHVVPNDIVEDAQYPEPSERQTAVSH